MTTLACQYCGTVIDSEEYEPDEFAVIRCPNCGAMTEPDTVPTGLPSLLDSLDEDDENDPDREDYDNDTDD